MKNNMHVVTQEEKIEENQQKRKKMCRPTLSNPNHITFIPIMALSRVPRPINPL